MYTGDASEQCTVKNGPPPNESSGLCSLFTNHCSLATDRPVRARLGVDALVGQPQPLHRTAVDQMLLHDLRCIFRLHTAVPNGLGIHDHRGSVLALIEAAGFVDAHGTSQARRLGQLLQLRMQFALSIRGARRPRRTLRTDIMADKNVALEQGQSLLLLLQAYRAESNAKLSTFAPAQPFPI